jgi:hypothetical protein
VILGHNALYILVGFVGSLSSITAMPKKASRSE